MSTTSDYWVDPNPLGEGAYGHVVHARLKATGRDVAVKVIDKATLRKRRYIIRERLWLQKFRESPWVVSLLASFHDAECAYLVLEISTGGDLSQLIAQAQANYAQRAAWHASIPHYGKQLADALAFLHEQARMVHGDLKPANILCSAEGRLQLADFDSARPMDQDGASEGDADDQSLVGTAEYASPELLRGSHNAATSASVDLWSLGCILYALWHGASPFQGSGDDDRSSHAAVQRVLEFDGNLSVNNLPSVAWSDMVSGLLQPNPAKRLTLCSVRCNKLFSSYSKIHPPFLPAVPSWRAAGNDIAWRDGSTGWQAFLIG